jgi:predicted RNase H-like nuclease (RuvC/YqgF family)
MGDVLPPPPGGKDSWFLWWQDRYGKQWADKQQDQIATLRAQTERLKEELAAVKKQADDVTREYAKKVARLREALAETADCGALFAALDDQEQNGG